MTKQKVPQLNAVNEPDASKISAKAIECLGNLVNIHQVLVLK